MSRVGGSHKQPGKMDPRKDPKMDPRNGLSPLLPSDTYPIEVLKKKKTKKDREYLVHYIGWPHSYDELKLAKDIEKLT